ncbi:FMN-binding protein [Frigoribacterium sp. Leaf186]|uniref:FMN-binding protein n=1 Tax=Frigoribacterium sp. Leaf186 TaxID=1736293 RepID=UPI0006FF10E0|nr:FMN-binding protein [Frigoribacterium sp. Leaf186]KQS22337.1 hypothetical protein ASG05_01735 [Frigoribacterium sp. Leaf186]
MSVRGRVAGVVTSAVVLVLGWQVGQASQVSTGTTATAPVVPGPTASIAAGATASPSPTTVPPSTAPPAATAPAPAPAAPAVVDGTYTGVVSRTPYGPVQVAVTVTGGALADVTAVQLTNDGGRSVQISNRAAPILRQEALAAGSANVQMVSGATYTSQGYLTSLQSALDQAGL